MTTVLPLNASSVCVALPIYKSYNQLVDTERISWQQFLCVLGHYPVQLIAPEQLDLRPYEAALAATGSNYRVQRFATKWFSSIDGYNRLMLSRQFYQRFADFEYLLLCQLDVFVFRDELARWCALGYSYVGAPWFDGYHPRPGQTPALWAVGNGGFSLRRVPDMLRALQSFALAQDWGTVVQEHFRAGRLHGYTHLHVLLKALLVGNNTYWMLNDFHRHRIWHQEDYFWGVICRRCFTWFRVPTPTKALEFGFEVQPATMYALNGQRLPMGCHAWEKYDPAFWKPFIEQYGYQMP